jgi:hypothetical protein
VVRFARTPRNQLQASLETYRRATGLPPVRGVEMSFMDRLQIHADLYGMRKSILAALAVGTYGGVIAALTLTSGLNLAALNFWT